MIPETVVDWNWHGFRRHGSNAIGISRFKLFNRSDIACGADIDVLAALGLGQAAFQRNLGQFVLIAGRDDGLVKTTLSLERVENWRAFLKNGDPADGFETKRTAHAGGSWPLGDDIFIGKLERHAGHSMKPRPRGHPRRNRWRKRKM